MTDPWGRVEATAAGESWVLTMDEQEDSLWGAAPSEKYPAGAPNRVIQWMLFTGAPVS